MVDQDMPVDCTLRLQLLEQHHIDLDYWGYQLWNSLLQFHDILLDAL